VGGFLGFDGFVAPFRGLFLKFVASEFEVRNRKFEGEIERRRAGGKYFI